MIIKRCAIGNKNIEDLLMDVAKYVKDTEELAAARLKSLNEFNKDDEIVRLNGEIDNIRRLSIEVLSEKEHRDFCEFERKHYEECKSKVWVAVSGTGIGHIIECKCDKCGEKLDITDIEAW